MAYNFSDFKKKIAGVDEWLKKEYSGIRTGRATPNLLDGVSVESYGARMTIPQVASVTIDDPKSLRVSPWDVGQVKSIEKAIQEADLGVSLVTDEKGVRVIFPELTSERRVQLVKLAKQKLEEARIRMRTERESVMKDIDKKEKEGEMTEDDKFKARAELQKIIDEVGAKMEGELTKKEKEISN